MCLELQIGTGRFRVKGFLGVSDHCQGQGEEGSRHLRSTEGILIAPTIRIRTPEPNTLNPRF